MKVDTAWLDSDGTIIGRAQKSPHDQGIMWAVEMPDGETFGAVLAKADAASVTQFCEMVRSEWNEREEESAAKTRRKYAEQPLAAAIGQVGEAIPSGPEEIESFSVRVCREHARAAAEVAQYELLVREARRELRALTAAMEALDAQEDDGEERQGVQVSVEQ